MSLAVEPIRVLLVEDSAGDAFVIRRHLCGTVKPEAEVYELEIVGSLAAALERLGSRSYDVLLLDLSLPDGGNGQLDGLVEVQSAFPAVPVVVLTGFSNADVAAQAVRQGAQDYLLKSEIDASSLRRAVRYAVERKAAQEALRASEERYALAVQGAHDGVWDWNLVTGETYFSRRWLEIIGCDDDSFECSPTSWWLRIHPDDHDQVRRDYEAHLADSTPHFETEYRIRHEDGSYRWALTRGIVVRDARGRPQRIAGSLTDITERKTVEEQLMHDALHDSLTGLPNRTLFLDRLAYAIRQTARRREQLFAVLFLDLDRFKNINDSLGHAVGDLLLVSIARRLESLLRPADSVARLGGDEFAILTADLESPNDATRVANRMLRELSIPYHVEGHEVYTSASIGITISSTGYGRAEDMLRDADTAMYRAKSLGKARHQVFDPQMHVRAVELLELETDLRRALDRDELCLHYQPIVRLESGRVEGFEALIRWQHPKRGLIYPDRFMSVAEETGLIRHIGLWVLRAACDQMSTWQKQFPTSPLSISVNLSGREFAQHDLVDQVKGVLSHSELLPGSLRLEITESMVMEDVDAVIAKLEELRKMAVRCHLDDFGTGFSSLSNLHRMPTDTLKIDRSFVSTVGQEKQGAAIVGTIVALARKLGMSVSAEGLETAEQVAQLRGLACQLGQGYYFSEPVDALRAEAMLADGGVLKVH